jgi:hypothetical protein
MFSDLHSEIRVDQDPSRAIVSTALLAIDQ